MTTFTLRQAVGEAMGYASRCWDENGVFESEKASEAVDDLLNAIAAFTKHAINYQSLDARCDMNDGEMVELIFQVPAMGYEPTERCDVCGRDVPHVQHHGDFWQCADCRTKSTE
jgi:hypothetical protein